MTRLAENIVKRTKYLEKNCCVWRLIYLLFIYYHNGVFNIEESGV